MKYNPALDGLRAVAILLVLVCHSGAVKGGLIGVDVFFVLSGYLITSILLSEMRQAGSLNLGAFYWRRFLRLAPAMGILVAFELARSLVSPHGQEIREGALVAAVYIQNLNNVFGFASEGLMGHTWSLSTEEQFYFLWPLALPLVVGRRPLVWLGAAVALMIVARFLPVGYTRPGLDFSPALRPVGLLVGCALALAPTLRLGGSVWPWLGALVALALAEEDCVLLAPLLASLATAGVIATARSGFLAWAPLRYVGKISYGLFLYHVPILTLGHKLLPGSVGTVVLLAVSFAAAALSYEFVEKPALRLRTTARMPAVVAAV